MIFGKTANEKYEEKQSKLKSLYKEEFTTFAWIPTQVWDGRFIWLQSYKYSYLIHKSIKGTKYTCSTTFWLGKICKKRYL